MLTLIYIYTIVYKKKIMFTLKEIIESKGLSQSEASRRIGVSRQAFSTLCNTKKYRVETLHKIMKGLNVVAITSEPDRHYFKLSVEESYKDLITLQAVKVAVQELANDNETQMYSDAVIVQVINNTYYLMKEKHPALNNNDLAVAIFLAFQK